MKSLIVIAVLAAVTVYNNAAFVPIEVDESQEEGHVYHADGAMHRIADVRQEYVMFHERMLHMPAIPHTVQHKDIHYRGNATARILAIWVSRPPPVPGHTNFGVLGTNHITVRVSSGPGDGLYTHLQFYGYYVD